MNDASCTSRYSGMPIYLNTICNPDVEACVKACPSAGSISPQSKASVSPSLQPSATDKLKELDALYKGGVINKEEYEGKKREILKAM
jgi:Short C-terminal domain